ncbi:MAG: acetyl/propionyl/methylcrotonyl-CoA carboxylase subunit alpha [Congregibacter sp.]
MFKRILIANRGEIACRVMRSAQALGIECVAVYSDADRHALHVEQADLAVHIGPSPASQSYLDAQRVLQAALDTGAEAIHPGYGFLSENAKFAAACEAAGIVFIGPKAESIDAMGSKARAKAIMGAAKVPLIPGYHGDDQSDDVLLAAADDMGYPVLIKAVSGGGGKGMRAVQSREEFAEALAAARRESKASFDDDRVLIEKLLIKPRHVEIQVFCDSQGNGVYLWERDCSIQRRHQKVVEEAPAPGMSEALRSRMGEAALAAAQAIEYRGAGTVEFLLDAEGSFYFMEMNTRLQVEHPVTEMITGLDLVALQLQVAAGNPLPLAQDAVTLSGHAMEVRIYAEDPAQDFLPSTGQIYHFRTPAEQHGVRVDTGVKSGSGISPYYDPMIAKLIAHGANREEARLKLLRALGEFQVAGPANNIDYLRGIVGHKAFARADLSTHFIDEHGQALSASSDGHGARNLAAAAIVSTLETEGQYSAQGNDSNSPWQSNSAWRTNLPASQQLKLEIDGVERQLEVTQREDQFVIQHGGEQISARAALHGTSLTIETEGKRSQGDVAVHGNEFQIFFGDGSVRVKRIHFEIAGKQAAAGDAGFAAPMHGSVVALLVDPGSAVSAGDPVIVIEAMKMEQTLRAPTGGVVEGFNCAPGDLVDRGKALVDFRPEGDDA